MAEKTSFGYRQKALKKVIRGHKVYLYRGCDLVHGRGWFSHVYTDNFGIGFGFHSTSKIAAVKMAMKYIRGGIIKRGINYNPVLTE